MAAGNAFNTQDELVTISAINGSSVTFSPALSLLTRLRPPGRQRAKQGFVVNMTPTCLELRIARTFHGERGHVMFLHNDSATVQ
jgi:hypothetical protein